MVGKAFWFESRFDQVKANRRVLSGDKRRVFVAFLSHRLSYFETNRAKCVVVLTRCRVCMYDVCGFVKPESFRAVEFLGAYLMPLSSKIIGFWIGKFKVFRKEQRLFFFFFIIRFFLNNCFSLFASTIIFYLI